MPPEDSLNAEPLGPVHLEREINALPDVDASSVVIDRAGRVAEIHVVASGGRQPKQLVRDIQTLAQARFGINLDYRVVSVVQMNGRDVPPAVHPPSPAQSRSVVARMTTSIEGATVSVEVELARGDQRSIGRSSGPSAVMNRRHVSAEAALQAVVGIAPGDVRLRVTDVNVVQLSGQRVVILAVSVQRSTQEELLVGSAFIRSDDTEAIVRAVLDAVERRVWQ